MRVIKSLFSLVLISILVTSCKTTQTGIGTSTVKNSTITKVEETQSLTILDIDFAEAKKIAIYIGQNYFTFVEDRFEIIEITNYDTWKGDIKVTINPQLVVDNKNANNYGIIYEVTSEGEGYNASMAPGYGVNKFFKSLDEYIQKNNLKEKTISDFKILKDKGIAQLIKPSIPTSYNQFKNYLDQSETLEDFEGIWEFDDAKYTIGIVKDKNDTRFKYKAFIIESKTSNWKSGEIKIKFNDLVSGQPTVGRYLMENKSEKGVTFQVSPNLINTLNLDATSGEAFIIKTYPTSVSSSFDKGMGTTWKISSNGYYITNAHVVENAETLKLGFDDNLSDARVVSIDKKNDIALLKVDKDFNNNPIPLINDNTIELGEEITVIGYPLAFTLGDSAKVTSGDINSNYGYSNDISQFQFSAPIQQGNSGGPIINSKGQAVGMVVSKLSGGQIDPELVNFAVKIQYIKNILDENEIDYTSIDKDNQFSTSEIYKLYEKSVLPVWINK